MREIRLTADGSPTVFDANTGAAFHSMFGALRESAHVFIGEGLVQAIRKFGGAVSIFEMGFGTGLNALLTHRHTTGAPVTIHYETIELYPLEHAIVDALADHYPADAEETDLFHRMHSAAASKEYIFRRGFKFVKQIGDLRTAVLRSGIQLVYFDAFAPDDEPSLWTDEIFLKLYTAMAAGGLLTTFCAKGEVRRTMLRCGFSVERIPGPPGKREMLRATKPS